MQNGSGGRTHCPDRRHGRRLRVGCCWYAPREARQDCLPHDHSPFRPALRYTPLYGASPGNMTGMQKSRPGRTAFRIIPTLVLTGFVPGRVFSFCSGSDCFVIRGTDFLVADQLLYKDPLLRVVGLIESDGAFAVRDDMAHAALIQLPAQIGGKGKHGGAIVRRAGGILGGKGGIV